MNRAAPQEAYIRAVKEAYRVRNEAMKETDHMCDCGTHMVHCWTRRTVYDGIFPLSGGGEVETVYFWECPKCGIRSRNND